MPLKPNQIQPLTAVNEVSLEVLPNSQQVIDPVPISHPEMLFTPRANHYPKITTFLDRARDKPMLNLALITIAPGEAVQRAYLSNLPEYKSEEWAIIKKVLKDEVVQVEKNKNKADQFVPYDIILSETSLFKLKTALSKVQPIIPSKKVRITIKPSMKYEANTAYLLINTALTNALNFLTEDDSEKVQIAKFNAFVNKVRSNDLGPRVQIQEIIHNAEKFKLNHFSMKLYNFFCCTHHTVRDSLSQQLIMALGQIPQRVNVSVAEKFVSFVESMWLREKRNYIP